MHDSKVGLGTSMHTRHLVRVTNAMNDSYSSRLAQGKRIFWMTMITMIKVIKMIHFWVSCPIICMYMFIIHICSSCTYEYMSLCIYICNRRTTDWRRYRLSPAINILACACT